MDPIDYVYVALSVCFGLVMLYMFSYNIKMRRRENELKQSGAPEIGKSANISRTLQHKG